MCLCHRKYVHCTAGERRRIMRDDPSTPADAISASFASQMSPQRHLISAENLEQHFVCGMLLLFVSSANNRCKRRLIYIFFYCAAIIIRQSDQFATFRKSACGMWPEKKMRFCLVVSMHQQCDSCEWVVTSGMCACLSFIGVSLINRSDCGADVVDIHAVWLLYTYK